MPRDDDGLGLLLRAIRLIHRPRGPTRADKKAAGLKYCAHAGYGYRWLRGKRVTDLREAATISLIVQLRQQGLSWYRIAAHLLRERVRTSSGREWSVARVRRAYFAHQERQRHPVSD